MKALSVKLNEADLTILKFYCCKYKITQNVFLIVTLKMLEEEFDNLEQLIGLPSEVDLDCKYRTVYCKKICYFIPDWVKEWSVSWKHLKANKNYLLFLLFGTIDPALSHPRHILRVLALFEKYLLQYVNLVDEYRKVNKKIGSTVSNKVDKGKKGVRQLFVTRGKYCKRQVSLKNRYYQLEKNWVNKRDKLLGNEIPGSGANLQYQDWEF